MKVLVTILLLTLSVSLAADWRVKLHPDNSGYYVINGSDSNPNTTWIKSSSKRAAKKLAKKLNKAEESVWNDGSEYCANPINEC